MAQACQSWQQWIPGEKSATWQHNCVCVWDPMIFWEKVGKLRLSMFWSMPRFCDLGDCVGLIIIITIVIIIIIIIIVVSSSWSSSSSPSPSSSSHSAGPLEKHWAISCSSSLLTSGQSWIIMEISSNSAFFSRSWWRNVKSSQKILCLCEKHCKSVAAARKHKAPSLFDELAAPCDVAILSKFEDC